MKQPASWYDSVYKEAEAYQTSYKNSLYLPIWAKILAGMREQGHIDILDLGCGPGQFAAFLHDNKISSYLGVDFSSVALDMARSLQLGPSFRFKQQDVTTADLAALSELPITCVVATEFLEHIEDDLSVLRRLPSLKRFYGSVPNFPYVSHVRHFKNEEAVYDRYSKELYDCTVETVKRTPFEPYEFFIVSGITKRFVE